MFEIIGVVLGFFISVLTIIGFVYTFLRNFKIDINLHIDKLEKRMDILDERMFLLATGKTLREAMIEEEIKKKRNDL
mgnify:CR=1 FL=1